MISLEQSVQYVKGIGPARAHSLQRLGIQTVEDLIEYLPRDWSDRQSCTMIARLSAGEKATIRGIVVGAWVKKINPSLGIFDAVIQDRSGMINAIWIRKLSFKYDVFNSLKKTIIPKEEIIIFGQTDTFRGRLQFNVEDYTVIKAGTDQSGAFLSIVPVYPLTDGIDQRLLRSAIRSILKQLPDTIDDIIPHHVLQKHQLLPRLQALKEIHFPSNIENIEKARRSLAYREFFIIECAIAAQRRAAVASPKGYTYTIKKNLLSRFKETLPYTFTDAQKNVINEIFSDMRSPVRMNRLLQGDVGSGKTVVAVSAMLLAAENGFQTAFMAPTELLAEQHFLTLNRFCKGLPITIGLLTSKMKPGERKKILNNVRQGKIHILIGTHALIEQDVVFDLVKLVIIDEQHRFGVMQRSHLKNKARADTLVMTATPIPRTLALTVYGDMDVSVIERLPPGRKPVKTVHLPADRAFDIIRREIENENQAFVVYPLVEESEKMALRSVISEWKRLSKTTFARYRVGLLYGQMPHHEKDAIMERFIQRDLDIIMATTVIEVGIDIPHATVMVIQHAETFGLSTLHQLRGRVGRGTGESVCILVGEPATMTAKRRFQIMLETNDGFRIGEEDLRLRGPGELIGTAQHGLPSLKAGNLITDAPIISAARNDAREFFMVKSSKTIAEQRRILGILHKKYGSAIDLVQVG